MHHQSFLRKTLGLAAIFLGLPGGAAAQTDGPTGVPVRLWGAAFGQQSNQIAYLQIAGSGFLPTDPVSGSGAVINDPPLIYGYNTYPNSWFQTGEKRVQMEPGKVYTLTVSAYYSYKTALDVIGAPGYQVEIDGMPRTHLELSGPGHAYTVRLLPPLEQFDGRAGAASSIANGRVYWQVALGALKNGGTAGTLALIDAGNASGWSYLFTPAGLQYEESSTEVSVYRVGNQIRQILANEAAVDVVTLNATSYELRFYDPGQKTGAAAPYGFTGNPYVTYRIAQGATATTLQITSETRDQASQAIARTAVTTLARTGAWPNFTWALDDWNTSGQAQLAQNGIQSGGTTQDRTESVTGSGPGGAVASRTSRTYSLKSWGEVLTAETRGSTNGLTTSLDYYTDPAQAGSYGYLKSVVSPGGGWEAYEYYAASPGSTWIGTVKYKYRPCLNAPATVTLDPTQGEVTYFEYTSDAFWRPTRPTLVETRVNNRLTARSVISYVDADATFINPVLTANNMWIVEATRRDYADAANYLTTVTRYYREDIYDDLFRGQIHAITRPDGVKLSFAYQRGTWNGSAFTKSANNGLDPGPASRIAVITGSASTGSACTTYDGYTVDTLYLVDGKSTAEISIRDSHARVVRTESYAWKSSAWNLVAAVNQAYDAAGLPTARTASNGAQYTAGYAGEQKTTETDESGITVSYAYDAAGRVATATKASGPTTTFAYDGEDRVLGTTVGAAGTGETIYSARTYDDAGRPATELPVGLATVNYSYNVAGRSRTATYPDASTRTEAFYADGRPDSVTGTAVVPQYFGHTIESDGRRTTQVWSGYSGSPRWQKATTDWLGRGLHTERPGFSISGQANYAEDNTYEAGTGRLLRTARTGLAPVRYEYDALSNVIRSGLDLGDNGLVLNSSDRITDGDRFFEFDGSGWWLRQETKAYPYATATAVTTAISRQRLTGHPANRLDETRVTDAEGNTVTRTVDLNRAAATATITITRPGVSSPQVETIVNGLATSVTGHDGLTSTAQYDALSRAWKSTDPRNNTFTTAYKYGTALVQSVTDGAGNSLGTVSYDGMARKQWAQDAAGQYTRFAYNLRGQLANQWGGGSYPVAYGYDATYGDSTALSTYRNAPAGDSASWPAVGAADTTTWTYDGATGLLWKKTDAATQVTEFDYNVRGQTSSRKWARTLVSNGAIKLTCSYGYDGNTGELLTQTYNDGGDPIPTPGVTYGSYTRLGQVGTVADGTGSRSFSYNAAAPWRLDNETLDAGFYASRMLTRQYDAASGTGGSYGPYTPGTFKGRYIGYDLGVSGNPARDQHLAYTTSSLGRFVGVYSRVTTGAGRDYVYNYVASSALVGGYTMGSPAFTVTRSYEAQRDVLASITSQWNGTGLSRYDYTVNALGQRTTAKQSGTAYADYTQGLGYGATYHVYNYNARGELETAARYRGDSPTTAPPATDELPAQRFEYRYDSIGNRKTAGATGTTADDTYTPNALNQYTVKDNKTVKVLGTAHANATVAVASPASGGPAATIGRKDRAWGVDLVPANSGGPAQGTATVYAALAGGGSGGTDLVRTETRNWFVPARTQTFSYDADGNMTGDGVWTYTYNAENQLVRMASVLPAGFTGRRLRLDFKYDYQGRRVEKRVYDNDTATETFARRYLYDGFNLIAEINANAPSTLTRTFTWGLDLAGSLSATGGVGALLQIDDLATGKTMAATYDGNGNLAALVNVGTGALEAVYEYDPSGNLLRSEGAYAKENPFRFSTKYQDEETGLINYGVRYYSPTLGRFLNRDPIAEKGGLNLYGFCGNDGINHWEYLGQSWFSKLFKGIGNAFRSVARFVKSYWRPIVAVVAAIVTYGVASGWAAGGFAASNASAAAAAYGGIGTAMGDMVAAMSAVTYVPSTFAAITAGAVGGAAAGAVSSAIMTGSVSGALKGAATGAIMGAIGGYYGNSWNLGRVGVTAVGGGISSEINGGSFRQGFEISGAIAFVTDIAYNMRVSQIANSRHDPLNASGSSDGFFGDAFKLGGGRINRALRFDDPRQVSWLGGRQGSSGSIFGWGYNPGSAPDHLVEAYAGPHDWLNSWWGYAIRNVGKVIKGDYAPSLSAFGQHLGSFAGGVAWVMNWVDIPLATPFAAASLVGVNPAAQIAFIKPPKG